MTQFRKNFDERLPALESATRSMPGDIGDYVPGFTRAALQRFFRKFSIQLGRFDKKGAKHPQYMLVDGQSAIVLLMSSIDNAIANMNSGAAAFSQSSFYQFIRIQDALDKAIGTDIEEVKSLSSSVAADLGAAVARTDELTSRAQISASVISEIVADGKKLHDSMLAVTDQIENDAGKISTLRKSLEQMANPDGRSKTSLDALAKRAREKISEVDEAVKFATESASTAKHHAEMAESTRSESESSLDNIRLLRKEAEEVLNLSSQAGLASSYKKETERLNTRSWVFTAILYLSSLTTIGVAAFYVLPELNIVLEKVGPGFSFWQALSFTLLRVVALAPLVYVIYFTTKRISDIELLRMDYAEKAAASLAYSGYLEQMNSDPELLRQLKGSLLIKFNEHPERLLRGGSSSSKAKIVTPGFEAETEYTHSPSQSNKTTDKDDSD